MKNVHIFTFLSLLIFTPVASAEMVTFDAGQYDGGYSVIVDSEPQGVPFAIDGLSVVHTITGTTPTRVVNLKAERATVHYGDIPDCLAPKPQRREVGKNVHFFGRYTCPLATVFSGPAETAAGVRLSPHQSEVIAGGKTKFTLAVHNYGNTPLSGLIASVDYDPFLFSPTTVPHARLGSDSVQWNVPMVKAGATWTTVFEGRVSDRLPEGKRVSLVGRIDGPFLGERSQKVSTATVGMPLIPVTGEPSVAFVLIAVITLLAATSAALTKRMQL